MKIINDKEAKIIHLSLKGYTSKDFNTSKIENLSINEIYKYIPPNAIEDIGKSGYSITLKGGDYDKFNYEMSRVSDEDRTLITASVEDYILNYLKPRARYYVRANIMRDTATVRNNLYAIFKNELLPQLQDKLIQAKPEYAPEIFKTIAFFSERRKFIHEVRMRGIGEYFLL